MKIILKYVFVFTILASILPFSSNGCPDRFLNCYNHKSTTKIIPNKKSSSYSKANKTLGLTNHPLRIEKHKSGFATKSTSKSISIQNKNDAAETVEYFEVILNSNDEAIDIQDTILVLNPSIQNNITLYFRTQPITIKYTDSEEEIDEIVAVSNQSYETDQCHKIIQKHEQFQDSLRVAHKEDGIWKEKVVYLTYNRITFEDNTEAIYRPYEFFNANDKVIYISETYTIQGTSKTIEVSKWCNSDGYPHVISSEDSDDHYDPVGCE